MYYSMQTPTHQEDFIDITVTCYHEFPQRYTQKTKQSYNTNASTLLDIKQ